MQHLRNFAHDPNIKGVILRINSPGGAVAPSQEIYREVIRLSKTKKVYASMSTVAASGGYYIASAASKIFALPGSITGSIGVIMQSMNMEELAKKVGVQMVTIKAGKNKDLGNAFRPMRLGERSLLESMLKETHRQFLADVQARRAMDPKVLAEVGDGRVLTGTQAKKAGLIDDFAGFKEVEDQLAHDLGLTDWELFEPKDARKEFFKSLESLSPFKTIDSKTGLYYLSHWLNE